jgi:hypothetical protein
MSETKAQAGLLDELGLEPEAKAAAPVAEVKAPEVKAAEPEVKAAPAPVTAQSIMAQRVAESREALKHPLGPGLKFFESPEGFIMVGEADKDTLFCRHSNKGKGAYINPRREG